MIDTRIWMAGSSLAVVAVLGLGWMIGISPKLAEADAAVSDRESVDAQNASHEAALVTLRDQFSDLGPLFTELADAQLEVPTSPDIETFIDAVNLAASGSGVTIGSITPGEAMGWGLTAADDPAAVPVDDAAGDSETPAATDGLYTVPVSMAIIGTPDQVLDFTDAMQTGKRLFLVDSVDFRSDGTESSGGTISGFLLVARMPSPGAATDPGAEDAGDEPAIAAG